jgi:threonine aldolase
MARYDFASDNAAPATPETMAALAAANQGFAPGYGADPICAKAAELIRGFLDADAEVRFVTSGTAANSVALAALCPPHEAVVAHEHAHILTDEAGAPGFFGHGVGLVPLPGGSGRIDPAALSEALGQPDVSYRQSPGALSLTNATEYGAVYSAEQLGPLVRQAKAKGLGVHLDGARLANAVAAGFDPKDLARLGVDILVIGGTKAGMTATEAVVILDKGRARRFDARLKQAGQLPSKARFLAAPFIGMLEDGAFVRHAAHANAMAARLAAACPFRLAHPVETNGVFVSMDEPTLRALHAAGWFAYRFTDGTVRFMCSWATTSEAVDQVAAVLKGLA